MTWTAVLAGALGCYLLKLAGLSVPERVLRDARIRRVGDLLPVAMLAALVLLQTFSDGRRLALDARAAGLAAALVAVRLRAPFLVVIAAAACTTAILRALA